MIMRKVLLIGVLLGLSACGDGRPRETSQPAASGPTPAAQLTASPAQTYDSEGVIVSVEGVELTLDHEGASAAGLKPGRDHFRTYADAITEAPLSPGARVSFQFVKGPEGLEVRKLEARP